LGFIETNTIYDWGGMLGVGFYLLSYALLQFGFLRGSGYTYALMNLVGASLVLFGLTVNFNLPSAIIQLSWILISTVGLIRIYLIHSRLRFNAEEDAFRRAVLPEMPRALARKMLNQAVWSDAEPGMRLTEEGAPVMHLYYLAEGAADVTLSGEAIATIRQGLIGEMNVMEKGAASATVEISAPSRLVCFSGETLRRMAASDTEFRAFLELHLSQSTRSKLVAANTRLANGGRSGP
jgi:CRP-like cAMP-binding protein